MSESSKQNDIVTEILDEVFNKDWDTSSPEEYKHQLAETQAKVKKLTPDEEKPKMNKRMNLRVRRLHFTERIDTEVRQHANATFKPSATPVIILPIPVICKRSPTLHLHIFVRLRNIGNRTKHRAPYRRKFLASVNTANMPAANTKCPKTRN